ncbi:MAG TPA: pyridoxal phosphate-dependent aminotransferase [Thermoanaerobaculia bacterium]
MTRARAPYMEWAKKRPRAEVDLAGSNLLACRLEDLPGAREALDIAGESPNGYPPLVAAIAEHSGVDPSRVSTAGGCSGANFLALAAILDAGDEVLIEWPGYDPLVAAARMLGGEVRFFERRFDEGWAIDPDRVAASVTGRTRAVVLSSPHNPSGVLASEEALDRLGALASRRGFSVLVDEVYLETVEGRGAEPAAARRPELISTNSLTKAFGLTALRCGWSVASRETAEAIRRARDVADVHSAIPADRLSVVAFRNLPALRDRARRILAANRDLWRAFADGAEALEWVAPDGSVVFPRFRDGRDAGDFASRLFDRHRVAVAPGFFFGAPSHFRVSLGGSTDRLARGLEAIARELGS